MFVDDFVSLSVTSLKRGVNERTDRLTFNRQDHITTLPNFLARLKTFL
jgi:hypothetical protein